MKNYDVTIKFPSQEAENPVEAAKEVIRFICENPSDIFVEVNGKGIDLQHE